jgi:hypothetical protein
VGSDHAARQEFTRTHRSHTALGTVWVGTGRVSTSAERRIGMLVAFAIILLIFALAGGIAVNPLLFVIALLALVVFLGGGRRGTVL